MNEGKGPKKRKRSHETDESSNYNNSSLAIVKNNNGVQYHQKITDVIERDLGIVSEPITYMCSPSDEERKEIEEFDYNFCRSSDVKRVFKKELLDKGTSYCLCYYWVNQRDFFLSNNQLCNFLRNYPIVTDSNFNPTQNRVIECKEEGELNDIIYNAGLMVIIKKNDSTK